jgi:hypothetical protein
MTDPKPAPSGSCSEDLQLARALSRQLHGVAKVEASGSAVSAPYVSFPKAPPPASTPSQPPVASTAPRPSLPLLTRRVPLKAPAAGFGAQGWNALLDACATSAGAEVAFLMDPQGLVVASRGPGSGSEELQGTGARLMVAFEQADHLEGGASTLSMTVETPRGTMHGVRLQQAEGGALTLGLLVPGGLSAERQARLVTVLTQVGG